ncbi:hypothetical protein QBA75_13570 [Streptomyces stelliscabiei]
MAMPMPVAVAMLVPVARLVPVAMLVPVGSGRWTVAPAGRVRLTRARFPYRVAG